MAWLYLVEENCDDIKRYKIGVTSAKDPNKRLKKLQTGNPNKLSFRSLFETDFPFKLEKLMHDFYKEKNILNEWYELTREDIEDFLTICEKKNIIITSLKDNPFFL